MLAVSPSDKSQITPFMLDMRARPLEERRAAYLSGRVQDQKNWYRAKSTFNGNRSVFWHSMIALIYGVPVIMILVFDIHVGENWPFFSLVLLIGASLFGWLKIKRFSELKTSYALAAREILMLETAVSGVTTEAAFSDLVNSSELAFSREHIQWVARKV